MEIGITFEQMAREHTKVVGIGVEISNKDCARYVMKKGNITTFKQMAKLFQVDLIPTQGIFGRGLQLYVV